MTSLLLQDAVRHQRFEAYLYALYNHIATIQSMTVELLPKDKTGPYVGAFLAPQPLLGFNLAETEDPDPDLLEAGAVTAEAAEQARRSGKLIGDFARVLGLAVNTDGLPSKHKRHFPLSRQIIDIWELKGLYQVSDWLSEEEVYDIAEGVMKSSFEQVYNQAMIEFLHNPGLNQLYSFLIVGSRFAQLLWKRPKDLNEDTFTKGLKDIPIPPNVPTLAEGVLAQFAEQISIFRNRALPEVLYANEPVFVALDPKESRWHSTKKKMLSARYQAVGLSPAFLQALERPLVVHFKSLGRTCTLFAPPGGFVTANPPSGNPDDLLNFRSLIQDYIQEEPAERLRERLLAAGFVERVRETGGADTEDEASSTWETASLSQASNSSTDTGATNDYIPSDSETAETAPAGMLVRIDGIVHQREGQLGQGATLKKEGCTGLHSDIRDVYMPCASQHEVQCDVGGVRVDTRRQTQENFENSPGRSRNMLGRVRPIQNGRCQNYVHDSSANMTNFWPCESSTKSTTQNLTEERVRRRKDQAHC
ncbi:uncharacterized protein BXZ73DRAFT_81768 [Epithele typhae]|uniref:uncharacterized protein n=1 Tax=Epithele typhae TaxID=378194 RepID=UPI0020072C47|nr:uncharacterized protein BXZ73DRAFT_81768 [Epithele typhae]KAH9913959.1 hypothetical protein BXZ73DRAFT_81768 [Epithele typhae]